MPWWKKDVRVLASVPVILLFAALLATLLTGIFVFEAFVTQLYAGPGHKLVVSCRFRLVSAIEQKMLNSIRAEL